MYTYLVIFYLYQLCYYGYEVELVIDQLPEHLHLHLHFVENLNVQKSEKRAFYTDL
jgi:hypothetical protein